MPAGRQRLERLYLEIVTGQRRGALAASVCALLRVASWVFHAAIAARALLFRVGLLRTHAAPCPVISVGNLSVGGTGKTPTVELIVRQLLLRRSRPAIVSRGYGAIGGAPNDEARLLAQNLPEVPHLQDPDRVRAAREACARAGADVIVLDDGFQHRRLGRDLDLVLVDATRPFTGDHLLPRGLLREPPSALRRADAVAITRADLVPGGALEALRGRIGAIAPHAPVLEVVFEPTGLGRIAGPGQSEPLAALVGRRALAFSGIGNPGAFFAGLRRLGLVLVGERAFPDHHAYTHGDLEALWAEAAELDASLLITTQKDAVKLKEVAPPLLHARNGARRTPPLGVLRVEARVRAGSAELAALLERTVGAPKERAA